MVLTLILAESAIELVPNEIVGHPAIVSWARRRRRDPHRLILDQSYHHSALLKLGRSGVGRGRPDIVHFSLLLALGSPLNMDHELRCYVHTRDDHVITVDSKARLPRNTDRFVSLLEQLYEESVVPPSGPPLMSLKRKSLRSLLEELTPDSVIGLTTEGLHEAMEEVARGLASRRKPVILVGGFPEGHFSHDTVDVATERYRIDRRRLEAWTVVARAIFDYEQAIGLRRF